MSRRGFSKGSRLLNVNLALVLLASSFAAPSSFIHGAPTGSSTSLTDNVQQSTEIINPVSENIIRSIGFRNCNSYNESEDDISRILLSSLALLYDGQANTISLRAEGSTELEFDATSAHVLLTAYDRVFYDQKIELSKVMPFIPRFKGRFSFQETFSAPSLLPEQLPRQLFSLPAVEALASIQLYNAQGNLILCTSVPLTNTVSAHSPVITIASVSLTAATVVLTAISSTLASLTSAAVLTSVPLAAAGGGALVTNPSSSSISSGLSPSVWDVVSFCQFIAMSGSLNLDYPELLQQWTQNFGWSMGLVPSEGWNAVIEGLRSRTARSDGDAAAFDGKDGEHGREGEEQRSSAGAAASLIPGERILYSGIISASNVSNANNSTTVATAGSSDGAKTVTVLSMQSIMDGAVKSFVEKSGYKGNKTEAIAVAMAKLDTSQFMSSSAVLASKAQVLHRRQVVATPTVALAPTTLAPLSGATLAPTPLVPLSGAALAPTPLVPLNGAGLAPTPLVPLSGAALAPTPLAPLSGATHATPPSTSHPPGSELLPSLTDNSLMNRIGDISSLKSLEPQPSLASSVVMSPSPMPPSPTPPASWPQGGYHPSTSPLTQPGLASFGERLNIPAKNMFMTSLFLFLILLLAASFLALILRIALEGYTYIRPGKFTKLRRRFSSYYLGNMLRVVLLAYFAVATMAFYQLTLKDSWAITLLAVMTLALFLVLVTYITLRLRRAGGTSLFFDERIKSKYGALYDQYVLSAYWFFIPVLLYQVIKAAIVGLGHGGHDGMDGHHSSSSSWVQASLLLLVEIAFAALLIWKHPFSDKTPNRLNGILGCVRVLNVVMLAVLIEGATVSTVSRTVVGAIITGTQALMMVILACLVLYQLARALFRLWKALKAREDNKDRKRQNRNYKNSLDHEEIISVLVKDKRGAGDDEDNEPQGRMAGEHSRLEEGSMTSLVGMMGIGSNPTIRYTPASDDEDDVEDDDEVVVLGHEDFEKDLIPGRYLAQDSAPNFKLDEEMATVVECIRGSMRDSAQSVESHLSLILDYYNPSYLPPSIRSKVQENREALGTSREAIDRNEDGFNHILNVSSAVPNEPWVQSAYMTRRSESSGRIAGEHRVNTTPQAHIVSERSSISQRPQLELEEEEDEEELQWQVQQELQQRRRRPFSVGLARQNPEPMMFNISSTDLRSRASRLSLGSPRVMTTFPTFQGMFIPDSLLAGPPPPSSQPRRTSVSTATLATPWSMSPVIATAPESLTTSMSGSISNFEEYRFPDEGPLISAFEGVNGNLNRSTSTAVMAAQRSIHPLSPFHPDYQHPDDLYNAALSSSNEEGATTFFRCSPTAAAFRNTTVLNTVQDGTNSRRESRSIAHDGYTSASHAACAAVRKMVPMLRVDTTPKPMTQPPQVPVPTLPMTPLSASMINKDIATATCSIKIVGSGSKELHHQQQQQTPVSSLASSSSDVYAFIQEPHRSSPAPISTALVTVQRKRSTSNMVECSLAGGSPQSGRHSAELSPSRQRALSTTPLAMRLGGSQPMTMASVHRDTQAAR